MKTSQWCRVVENMCVFDARLNTLSDRSVTIVLVADGSMWLVHGLRNFVVQMHYGCVEPVECRSLQTAVADE